MEVYPIGIRSDYVAPDPMTGRPCEETLPLSSDAEAISSDKFRSSEDTNPTYGRNGKVKVTAAAAEAQKFEKATQSKGKEEKQMQLLPRPGIKAVPLTSWAIHGGDSASAVPTMFVMHLAAVTSARER